MSHLCIDTYWAHSHCSPAQLNYHAQTHEEFSCRALYNCYCTDLGNLIEIRVLRSNNIAQHNGRLQIQAFAQIPGINSIRVATIHPGVGDDNVLVDLHIESFTIHSLPRYETLSYVWGSTEAPQLVYIGDCDRTTLQVTANLKTAMQHLRYLDQERVMWVDCLCIKQSDDIEKGAEVARMGELFAWAAHVVVWLGPEANGSGMAMERLEYIGSQVDVEWAACIESRPLQNSRMSSAA